MTPRQFIHKTFGRDVTNGKGIENLLTKYAEHMINLKEFSRQILENGGSTTSLNLTHVPTTGFMVSLEDNAMTFENLNNEELSLGQIEQSVKTFVQKNAEQLSDHINYLGGWIHENKLYIDISVNIQDKREAIEFGIKNNQIAIYDLNDDCEIVLPTPQRHGTLTQRRTYMELAINKLCQL